MRTARRARPSIGEGFDHGIAVSPDFHPEVGRRRLGVCRLAKPDDSQAASGELLRHPVEEDIAARLGDVEQSDRESFERCRPGGAGAIAGITLAGRIEQLDHLRISCVTGSVPAGPLTHPAMMAEKRPAVPPACTNSSPPGRNLATVAATADSGIPSAIPPAPFTISAPGKVRKEPSSSRSLALDQPASRKTRPCSGEMTQRASQARPHFGCPTTRRQAANDRASASGVRASWSKNGWTPEPANNVTAEVPGGRPRSTERDSQGEVSSASAKQKVYLPGLPSVARSISPGRPPPTLRITSCSARPMVALARLPCPRALIPEFIPISRAMGPLTMTTGPTKQVVARMPWMLKASVHAASIAA